MIPVPLTPEGGSHVDDDDFEDRFDVSRHLQGLLEDPGQYVVDVVPHGANNCAEIQLRSKLEALQSQLAERDNLIQHHEMAQVAVAREQDQHIARHKIQVAEYTLAERYQQETVMEVEVRRAATLEVIEHEAKTGRSALTEAFTSEQMEFGRLLRDSRAASALEVRDALRSIRIRPRVEEQNMGIE